MSTFDERMAMDSQAKLKLAEAELAIASNTQLSDAKAFREVQEAKALQEQIKLQTLQERIKRWVEFFTASAAVAGRSVLVHLIWACAVVAVSYIGMVMMVERLVGK